MRKGKLISKVFGIALVLVMIGAMVGGLLASLLPAPFAAAQVKTSILGRIGDSGTAINNFFSNAATNSDDHKTDGEILNNPISASWSSPVTIVSASSGWWVDRNPSIAVDWDGNWHMVYRDQYTIDSTTHSSIKYINSTSGPHIIAEATLYGEYPPSGGVVWGPSMDVDPNGAIHVVYGYVAEGGAWSIKYTTKEAPPVPVLLVHGWRGSPENWNLIKPWLEEDGYIVEILSYNDSQHAHIAAGTLSNKVDEMLEKYDVEKIDIIAHSFGGLVSRYYIEDEEMGRDKKVRKLIMLDTPNKGTFFADILIEGPGDDPNLFNIAVNVVMSAIKVVKGWDEWGSTQDCRVENNDFLMQLNADFESKTPETKYYVVMGTEPYEGYIIPVILPAHIGSYAKFLPGPDDGFVTVESAKLPGVDLYCTEDNHSSIIKNQTVYTSILEPILKDQQPSPICSCPQKDPLDNQWIPNFIEMLTISLEQGESYQDVVSVHSPPMIWIGFRVEFCDFDFTLVSPSGREIDPTVAAGDPNVTYVANETLDEDNYWYYTIRNPEPGEWQYNITAVEVPEEGVDVGILGIAEVTGCYIGAYLGCGPEDLSCESISDFNDETGKNHAIFVRYVDIAGSEDSSHFDWAEEVQDNGAMPMFIYDPWDGLDAINISDVEYFASECNELDTTVFIVFGHEMNGPWYHWGNDPDSYITKFEEVAEIFHENAPNVEMCWVPNQNWGYPWGGTDYGDGYSEYYPEGAGTYGEYVDWVGLNFYEKDWDEDNLVPSDMFVANIRNGQDSADFYEMFAVGKNKPMLIAEMGAFDPNKDPTGAGERNPLTEAEQSEFKNEWLGQAFNVTTLQEEFPRLNAICYFHVSKTETIDTQSHSFYDITADYRIPGSPNVYKELISDPYFIGADGEWDPWVYDENSDGKIQKMEAIQAVMDYFDLKITKAQVLEVLLLYFS